MQTVIEWPANMKLLPLFILMSVSSMKTHDQILFVCLFLFFSRWHSRTNAAEGAWSQNECILAILEGRTRRTLAKIHTQQNRNSHLPDRLLTFTELFSHSHKTMIHPISNYRVWVHNFLDIELNKNVYLSLNYSSVSSFSLIWKGYCEGSAILKRKLTVLLSIIHNRSKLERLSSQNVETSFRERMSNVQVMVWGSAPNGEFSPTPLHRDFVASRQSSLSRMLS